MPTTTTLAPPAASGVQVRLRLSTTGEPDTLPRVLTWLRRRGCALTRDDILNAVWGHSVFVTSRSVDRCVATLRAKIESDDLSFIETIRDVGYRFDPAAADTFVK